MRSYHKIMRLRYLGAIVAVVALCLGIFAGSSEDCGIALWAVIIGPILGGLCIAMVSFLPKNRNVNTALVALLALLPITGLALGHWAIPASNGCP